MRWPRRLRRSARHLEAGCRAAPADLRAGRQVGIFALPVALVRAVGADGGARAAGMLVLVGAPDHEVGGGAADLGAVEQQPDQGFLEARGALAVEMTGGRFQADPVAVGTVLDALLHRVRMG